MRYPLTACGLRIKKGPERIASTAPCAIPDHKKYGDECRTFSTAKESNLIRLKLPKSDSRGKIVWHGVSKIYR